MHICRDSDNNVCKVDEPDIVWFLGPCLRKEEKWKWRRISVPPQKRKWDMLWSEKESQCDTVVDYKLSRLIWMHKTHQIYIYAQTSVLNHEKRRMPKKYIDISIGGIMILKQLGPKIIYHWLLDVNRGFKYFSTDFEVQPGFISWPLSANIYIWYIIVLHANLWKFKSLHHTERGMCKEEFFLNARGLIFTRYAV